MEGVIVYKQSRGCRSHTEYDLSNESDIKRFNSLGFPASVLEEVARCGTSSFYTNIDGARTLVVVFQTFGG